MYTGLRVHLNSIQTRTLELELRVSSIERLTKDLC